MVKKKKKPLRQIRDPKKQVNLRKRFRKTWLPRLNSQLTDLLLKQDIFWKLQDIAKSNPKILKPGAFFDWMCSNYNYAITVGLRKFDDQDSRSRSLWNMLSLILEHPGVISRSSHKALYRKSMKAIGDSTFDKYVGRGMDSLSRIQIQSDLRNLKRTFKRIRLSVNKDFAHFAKLSAIRRKVKYEEVDEALAMLVEMLFKYNLLLSACSHEFHSEDDSWMKVLKDPWVKS